jgi:DNA-binding FadR family transcriptional regulator
MHRHIDFALTASAQNCLMSTDLVDQPVYQFEAMAGMDGRQILAQVPTVGHRLDRRTARDVIAEKLMVLIATNMLRPGDELPGERELANVLHVSRETIRGAIQSLSARGILDVSHGSRTRVANVDLSHTTVTIASPSAIDSYDLDSVHAARLLVELDVVANAADNIDEEALQKLEALLEAHRLCGDDAMRFLICDREFHVAIYRACGNPLLADFVTDLYTYMMDHRRNAMSRPGAIAASYQDHSHILDALKRRDREAVIAAFRHHLMRIYETTKELLAGSGQRDLNPSQA